MKDDNACKSCQLRYFIEVLKCLFGSFMLSSSTFSLKGDFSILSVCCSGDSARHDCEQINSVAIFFYLLHCFELF